MISSHPIPSTPPKFDMEPENHGIQKDLSFSWDLFSGSMLSFGGVTASLLFEIARFIFLGEATHTTPNTHLGISTTLLKKKKSRYPTKGTP